MNGKKNVHPGTKQVQCLKEMRKKLPWLHQHQQRETENLDNLMLVLQNMES